MKFSTAWHPLTPIIPIWPWSKEDGRPLCAFGLNEFFVDSRRILVSALSLYMLYSPDAHFYKPELANFQDIMSLVHAEF